MKKLIAIALFAIAGVASAACPPGTRYDCQSTFSGKQSCGCR